MVNYKLGKIYRLECNETGLIYVGSTAEPTLAKRLTKHVGSYKQYLKGKARFCSSFNILVNKNYVIILIEKYPCSSRDELVARERYYTHEIDCINIVRNQGIEKELGISEYNKRNSKQYYLRNIEKIKESRKEYYEKNKDLINTVNKDYYEKNKEYREKNKDRIKDYYVQNKDKLNEKHECECGGRYSTCHKSAHFKTKKHFKYIQENESE
jgi:hypothetical protein